MASDGVNSRFDERVVYQFGPFRLDPAERRLLRDGAAVPITPKMFDTLRLLVERAGRIVAKDELLATVWAGATVEEANLTVTISSLRRLLRGADDEAQYIETVPKYGYRFLAPVRQLTEVVA